MLEQLFGSRTRWKLLKTFLSNPDDKFYIRELTRITDEKLNSVRRELANLESWGIIASEKSDSTVATKSSVHEKKYYRVQTDFVLYSELKNLITRSWLLVEKSLAEKIAKMGNIKMLILSGRFVDHPEMETDVLVVGSINRDKLKKLMKELAKSFGEDVHYTVMTPKEFQYRKDVTDRFLYKILETGHIKIIDKTQ